MATGGCQHVANWNGKNASEIENRGLAGGSGKELQGRGGRILLAAVDRGRADPVRIDYGGIMVSVKAGAGPGNGGFGHESEPQAGQGHVLSQSDYVKVGITEARFDHSEGQIAEVGEEIADCSDLKRLIFDLISLILDHCVSAIKMYSVFMYKNTT